MHPDPFYKSIGAIIKSRRKTLGQKQETLAATLRISRGSLANIETGKQRILVHQLYNLAQALKIRPADLLPPISTKVSAPDHGDLPFASDVRPEHRKQIEDLIREVDTSPKPSLRIKNVKH